MTRQSNIMYQKMVIFIISFDLMYYESFYTYSSNICVIEQKGSCSMKELKKNIVS